MQAPIAPPRTAARGSIRRAFQNCLFGLGALAAFASSTAHAQYADWTASPPKIMPNERPGSGNSWQGGSGRQFANPFAFAALAADRSIRSWGSSNVGGSGAPSDTGYKAIYSNQGGFAALKGDGSIKAWGWAKQAPTDSGYVAIHSTVDAFAALRSDGAIRAWGSSSNGGSGAPTDLGYTAIFSNWGAFAALKADGSITAWGYSYNGGTGAPTDKGYVRIYSNRYVFVAMKADGSVSAWGGDATNGGTGAPTNSGYVSICSNNGAFAALDANGGIRVWGDANYGGSHTGLASMIPPTGTGYTAIFATDSAFAALKNGFISTWGPTWDGGMLGPTDGGYVDIESNSHAFVARKANGSLYSWGSEYAGGLVLVSGPNGSTWVTSAPAGAGHNTICSNQGAFAALNDDGTISEWGSAQYGGSGAPEDSGYTAIYASAAAFAALKTDGSIHTWGRTDWGGIGAPTGDGFRFIQSVQYRLNDSAEVTVGSGGVSSSTASVTGAVAVSGSAAVTERGWVYAPTTISADPVIAGAGVTRIVDSGSGAGSYSSVLGSLLANTAYALKAYAIDAGVVIYSDAILLSTNLLPVITSESGASIASVSVAENTSAVTTVSATDADAGQTITYSITGGADAARFAIGSSSGALTFVTAPDFEAAADANADNAYEVIVAATDNGNTPKSATQTLTVSVTNVADSGEIAVEQPATSNVATGRTVAFGSVTVGQSLDLVFTVRSSGEVPLLLSGAAISGTHEGDFALVDSLPSSLAIGSSTTFTVRFTPSGGGTRSAVLSLSNNDQSGGESPFVINLSGTGATLAIPATYSDAANQVRGGWINSGNFTIGAVGTTNPGNNWPSGESPDKVVDANTASKFLIYRNNNAGLILSPTNANVVFNRLSLSTANDSSERDPASYVIYGSSTLLSGTAGTNISLEGLTELAFGSITLPDNRSTGPTVVQFANTTAYASYIVAFPTVRSTSSNNITQISEVQLSQGINPPCVVAMAGARGGQLSSGTFTFGSIGNTNPGTNWNSNESPDQAIDGSVDTKYLLFRSTGAGLIASPQAGPARVNRLSFWTANDFAERDPLTYQVYGFATAVTARSGTLNVATNGTLLGSGTLTLPATRNSGPQTVTFDNSTVYASYLVVFPTVKNSPSTTIMQISEVQFGYNGVPTFQAPTRTVMAGVPRATAQIWQCITSSADGTKLAAAGEDSQLYTSSDSGVTWTAQANAGTRKWRSIALSADGTKMVAGAYPSQLYTSTDSGVTWTARETSRYWRSVASSSDGTKLAAVVTSGQIYTSTDSGVTWTARASARNWNSIASSVDGTKLVAAVAGGQIYTSTDSGVTWTARESTRTWNSLASSADGTKLVAAVDDGQLYTSGDSGATWTARESIRSWKSVACSADGTKMAAVAYGTQVYVSTDSGSTWAALDSVRNWVAIASSSDGGKLVGTVLNGQIYTLQDVALPDSVTVAEDSGSFNQAGVVTGITPGIGDVGQTVSLSCTNDSSALFSVQPAISADGTLTFTPAANANGSATVTVVATDSTGLSSASQTFTIIVTSVVDAPFLATAPTSASITTTTATLGGEVTASEATVTERGVAYAITSANAAPQIGGTGVTQLSTSGATGVFTADVSGLTAGTGYSFRAYATSSAGTSYSEVGTFTTVAAATHTDQELWRFANFGSYDSTGAAADDADPDHDGLNNLLEYVMGSDPNASGMLSGTLALNGANLEYTYARSTAAKDAGVTYQVQWSDTLEAGSWSTQEVTDQITTTQGALETVKASVPIGSGGKRFLRLRVMK